MPANQKPHTPIAKILPKLFHEIICQLFSFTDLCLSPQLNPKFKFWSMWIIWFKKKITNFSYIHKPFGHITFFSNHQIEKKKLWRLFPLSTKKIKLIALFGLSIYAWKGGVVFIINLKVSKTNLVFYRFKDEDILFFFRFSLWPRLNFFSLFLFLNKHFYYI